MCKSLIESAEEEQYFMTSYNLSITLLLWSSKLSERMEASTVILYHWIQIL